MERGLMWLPLLLFLGWLGWNGWNEYQKLEVYQRWAEDFDMAKYDIYAAIGQKDDKITWGKPTRSGIVDLKHFSLKSVQEISLLVDDHPIDVTNPPQKGKPNLVFELYHPSPSISIPFTDVNLALKWLKYLQNLRNEL